MTMNDTMTILGVRNPAFANSSDGVEDDQAHRRHHHHHHHHHHHNLHQRIVNETWKGVLVVQSVT